MYGGGTIYEVVFTSGVGFHYYQTADAYDCCAMCMTTANCEGSIWGSNNGGFCYLLTGTTCSSQGSNIGGTFLGGSSQSNQFTLSNGNCGYFHAQ